jgi:hypothetical protein
MMFLAAKELAAETTSHLVASNGIMRFLDEGLKQKQDAEKH